MYFKDDSTFAIKKKSNNLFFRLLTLVLI